MTEKDLQVKWHNYAKLRPKLRLNNGDTLQILSPGTHNENESGPDFLNATIRLNDIEWHGNIELHFKSSDWYAHAHHVDANYGNVILHVVLNQDCAVECLGTSILQYEIPQNHLWRRLNEDANFTCPPCSGLAIRPSSRVVNIEKRQMLEEKLNNKVHQFQVE